jgi:HTH-type transcriptional regulator/antitoxin HigA
MTYQELIIEFPLKPIKNHDGLKQAVDMIDKLIDIEELNDEEQDYLDVLSLIVEEYEDEHHPMPPIEGYKVLEHIIESRNTSYEQVSKDTGIHIKNLKGPLSNKNVLKLAKYFNLNVEVFNA